jgi:hypothetical protein
MSIHDIEMQPIGAGFRNCAAFITDSHKIAGEKRRCNDKWQVMHTEPSPA